MDTKTKLFSEQLLILELRMDILQDLHDILPWWAWRRRARIRKQADQIRQVYAELDD